MKDFNGQSRLQKLPLHSRLVYSSFLLFTLVGLALSAWLTSDMVGMKLERFEEYYAGVQPAAAPVAAETTDSGPVLDLPEEMTEQPPAEPMARRKLLEVTHFHLFSMPVYLLILAHIFVVSSASKRSKSVWVAVALGSMVGHMLAPWVGASGSAGATALYALSGTGLGVSLTWMALVPLWEMWVSPRTSPARGVVRRAETASS